MQVCLSLSKLLPGAASRSTSYICILPHPGSPLSCTLERSGGVSLAPGSLHQMPTVCSSPESLRVPTGWRDKDWRGAICGGDGLCQGRVVWRGAGRAPWEERWGGGGHQVWWASPRTVGGGLSLSGACRCAVDKDGASEEASVECVGGYARHHSIDAASILLSQQCAGRWGGYHPHFTDERTEAREVIAQGHTESGANARRSSGPCLPGISLGNTGNQTVSSAVEGGVTTGSRLQANSN